MFTVHSLILLAALAGQPTLPTQPELPELPEMALPALTGEMVALHDLNSKGPILLDFWATWCQPCLVAFPHYAELESKYEERGFSVVTVNQDAVRNQKRIAPLLQKLGLQWRVLLDPDGKLSDGMGVLNLPTSFLIDADGTVRYRHIGFVAGDERALESELRTLLALPSLSEAAEPVAPPAPH